jgi:tetratricopeptide (TPR) repeat protein
VIAILLAHANRRERALSLAAQAESERATRARQQAVAESEHAREEARKATLLSDFLVRLFQSSDPLGLEGRGFREASEGIRDLTAIQVLRRGADRVKTLNDDTTHDGATVATLLDAIGNSLRSLGDIEHARPLLEEAVRRRDRLPNPDPLARAESLFHLAILEHDCLESEAAEARYREAIQLYQQAGAERAVSRVKFRLAWLLAEMKRSDDAELLFREVLRDRQSTLGPSHPEIQVVRLALIILLLDRGDQKAVWTQGAEILGSDNVAVSTLMAYLRAMALRRARSYSAAKQQYEKVLGTARSLLPAQHPILALLLGDMAGMYRETGELERAEKLILEALDIGRRTIPLHPAMLEGLTKFADELVRQGRIEAAERFYVEAIGIAKRRAAIDKSDATATRILERLLQVEHERGRFEQEEKFRSSLGAGKGGG